MQKRGKKIWISTGVLFLICLFMFFSNPIPFSFLSYSTVLAMAVALALFMGLKKGDVGWILFFSVILLGGGFYLINSFFTDVLKGDQFLMVVIFHFLWIGTINFTLFYLLTTLLGKDYFKGNNK